MALSHTQARSILDRAWRRVHGRAPTARELLYAQAIAYLESHYGRAGQFATLAARGQYSWGALQRRPNPDGTCPSGTASGVDQGSVCFYVYPTDEDAATAFVRTLTTKHWPVIAAMRGTPEDVATAMRVPPAYYAGYSGTEADRIAAYARAIRGSITAFGAAIPGPAAAAGGFFGLVLMGGAAFLGYRYVTRHKR